MGEIRSDESVVATVVSWFELARAVSLELPGGWFGLPYDNQLTLARAEMMAGRLLLDLDGEMLLVLSRVREVIADRTLLTVTGLRHGMLTWDDFGGERSHSEVFGAGEVRFHAPQGQRITPSRPPARRASSEADGRRWAKLRAGQLWPISAHFHSAELAQDDS